MKNFKKIFAFLFVFVGLIILASCGDDEKLSFNGKISNVTTTNTTATIQAEFDSHEKFGNGLAVPSINLFAADASEDADPIDAYSLTFSNTSYVLASVTIENLEMNTEYEAVLIITCEGNEYELDTYSFKTSNFGGTDGEVVEITNTQEFLAMADNPEGHYKLANDILFSDNTDDLYELKGLFTESKPFKGVFDGNNHKISNFEFSTITSTTIGVFGATDGATIKNLVIENAEASFTYGKTGYIGILAGYLENTVVDNITINNPVFELRTSTTTTMIGSIAGFVKNSTITNVNINNANVELTRARGTSVTGLAVGRIEGTGVDSEYLLKNVYATGKIDANAYINSSTAEGSIYLGGLIGAVSTKSSALIEDCAVNTTITLSREASDSYKNYNLYIGGFAGAATGGSANIVKCAAIADIAAYAGAVATDDTKIAELRDKELVADKYDTTDTSKLVTDNHAYIAGFIGNVGSFTKAISNCVYVAKEKGILVAAKNSDVSVNSLIAKDSSNDAINNLFVYEQELLNIGDIEVIDSLVATDLTIFSEAINTMIQNKNA